MGDSIDLADLNVLALDCQATGANPGKGRLLEIGWLPGRAGSACLPELSSAESCLVRSQAQMPIPAVVQRLTGITDAMMAHAVDADVPWRQLKRRAGDIAARNGSGLCPAVIHFARFEEPFLRHLHDSNDPETPFPFHIICTHAMAARLLPGLPRKGIRAVSGYLGHAMPELKRSADHALATLFIWRGLVDLLRSRFKIRNLGQLTRWLVTYAVPGRTQRTYPMNKTVRSGLPDQPGVYRMRGPDAGILYIGKAKSLKQRVNSYFRASAAHPEHILEMLSQARDIDYAQTRSALEAAAMESDEIKHHCPPYNRALRPERRGLVFLARDLKGHAIRCDRHHCIGPLPDGRPVDALGAFETWMKCGAKLTDDALCRIGRALLPPYPDHAPEVQCLKEGFGRFRDDHRSYLQNRSALRIVTSLGARLWRQRLETMAGNEAEPDVTNEPGDATNPEAKEAAGEPAWTPAGIAGAIESLVMHAAHMMRRARWYGLLSESCLAWASNDNPKVLDNLVVVENGTIRRQDVTGAGQRAPDPAGFGRPWLVRRSNLDLAAYDRMRVVTTELRRLVREGRKIELRLGPNARLTRAELTRALKWV